MGSAPSVQLCFVGSSVRSVSFCSVLSFRSWSGRFSCLARTCSTRSALLSFTVWMFGRFVSFVSGFSAHEYQKQKTASNNIEQVVGTETDEREITKSIRLYIVAPPYFLDQENKHTSNTLNNNTSRKIDMRRI